MRVSTAAVSEERIYAHNLTTRCRMGSKATHTSLRSYFVKGNEAAADYCVNDVLLQRDFFDFGFRVKVQKKLLLQLEYGSTAPDQFRLWMP